MAEAAQEAKPKYKIRVSVVPRPVPGASNGSDGSTPMFPGYGCAGIYFPNGDSEHEVTEEQLATLRASKKPKDGDGRPQFHPFTFIELDKASQFQHQVKGR